MSDTKQIIKEDPKDRAIVEAEKKEIVDVGPASENREQKTEKQSNDNVSPQKEDVSPQETDQPKTDDSKPTTDPPAGGRQPITGLGGKWFVVHTYSGHENKAAEALKQRIAAMGLAQRIFDVIVPTRNIVIVRHGKKEQQKEKIFPGYILVRMILDDESWLAVRTTPGVTAFVGMGNRPTPISDKEVEAIMKFMKMEAPIFKAKFTVGEAVKIVDGPFADFLGAVESIDEAKGKVKVLVSIFGRETPVELDFLQVTKL